MSNFKDESVGLAIPDGDAAALSLPEIMKARLAAKRAALRPNHRTESYKVEAKDNKPKRTIDPEVTAGLGAGSMESANLYSDQVRFNASGGHGFAAEQGNHLADKLKLKDAIIVGDDNALNGADRVVNGVNIQSKYCATGSRCINSCFDKDGNFRYINSDNSIMQIEVPSDKYEAAVQSMRAKIEAGKIPGVTDPDKATEIVRKGNLTYKQAVNIAKFGTFESITFDAINGIKVGAIAGSLSATIAFGHAILTGKAPKEALQHAAWAGLKVGGTALAISVVTSQLGRTAFEQAFRKVSLKIVEKLSDKVVHALVRAMTGKALTGAAAQKTLAKLLRGNLATLVVTTTIMTVPDVIRIVRGRISGAQLTKNLTTTTVGIGAGYAGWMAGAAYGTLLLPGAGTIVGGAIGSIGASLAAGKASSVVMDQLIIDDSVAMQVIFEQQLILVATDYLLSSEEVDLIVQQIIKYGFDKFLMELHATEENLREHNTYMHLAGLAQKTLSSRPPMKAILGEELTIATAELVGELTASLENAKDIRKTAWADPDPIDSASFAEHFRNEFISNDNEGSEFFWGDKLRTTKGRKKLGNAMAAFGRTHGGVPIHNVLALIDITVFGTGTDGIIITDEAMWVKPFLYDCYKIDFQGFPGDARIVKHDLKLRDYPSASVVSDRLKRDVERVLSLIKRHHKWT
ncbi:hypothetical protein [Stutzerimonas chloritidismutans]|nr:hypothetical protein [Stutzerimonas chloritidismutans]